MDRVLKFRAWDGVIMLYTEFHDRNWYDSSDRLVKEKNQRDQSNLNTMQFTGRIDKNEVDIYEDDILEGSIGRVKRRFIIEWNDMGCSFVPKNIYNGKYNSLELIEYYCHVIGNIHENPELIL